MRWYELVSQLNSLSLCEGKDEVKWRWGANKKFTVKYVYLQLTKNDRGQDFHDIWKAKLPLKIKIFMWMVAQKAILTKENMVARN
jgi:hypothetical protein